MPHRSIAPPRRRAVLAPLLALLAALGACSEPTGPGLVLRSGSTPAPVEVTRADPVERLNYHWFGEVAQGEVLEHTFVYDNVSPSPISVLRAIPACGCLELEVLTREPDGAVRDRLAEGGTRAAVVPPGGTLDVTFVVRTALVRVPNVPRLVTADVQTDDPLAHVLRIEASVVPLASFQMVPDLLDLGTIARSAWEQRRVTISAIGPRDLAFTGEIAGAPADWLVVLNERPADPALPRTWDLDVTVAPGTDERFATVLALATVDETGAPGRPWEVPVKGRRGDAFFAAPEAIYFRGGRLEATGIRVGSRVEASKVEIERVVVEGPLEPFLDVEVRPGAPLRGSYKSWVLLPKLDPGAPEECSGRVLVCFDDDTIEDLEVPYFRFP